MTTVKRPYHSPAREAQAARTRAAIIDAARRLLAAGGLTRATIEAIATEAGVAVQTVYATYGSKPGILLALLEQIEVDAEPDRLLREQHAATAPMDQVRAIAGYHRRMFERGADVIAASIGSLATDPDIAGHVQAGHQRRRAALASVVDGWRRDGLLRQDLRPAEAIDIAWALTSPDLYLLHVRGSGWSPAHYQRWLEGSLAASILEG